MSNVASDCIWECLNSGSIVDTDPATRDSIGGLEAHGFTVYRERCGSSKTQLPVLAGALNVSPSSSTAHSSTSTVSTSPSAVSSTAGGTKLANIEIVQEQLDDSTISQWIERDSIAAVQPPGDLHLKLLMIETIMHQEQIRLPENAAGVNFSRDHVCKHFGCQQLALEKIGRKDTWAWNFPDRQMANNGRISCTGFGTDDLNLIWMCRSDSQAVWAVVIFKFSANARTKNRFIADIKRLAHYCSIPAFLPFIAINASLASTEYRIDYHCTCILKAQIQLSRYPNGADASSLYGAAIATAGTVASDQRNATTMKKVLERYVNARDSEVVRKDPVLRKQAAELKSGLQFQRHILEGILEEAEECQTHIARQIESVLGFMAQAQSKLSIEIAKAQSKLAEASQKEQLTSVEIAKASQSIALETKKDGSSMKTLAVVTLVYLPCTTVSSILAMPLFDWDAENGAVVNPRIWVYFVVAVPLTIATVVIWQLWLGMRARKTAAQAIASGVAGQAQSIASNGASP